MSEPLAYLNGRFLPASQAAVPVTDGGFVQGVTVAEQLRTFGGALFRLDRHLDRLWRSLEIVGVASPLSREELAAAARRLAAENHALLAAGDDLGLSIFVTPGPYATFAPSGGAPTLGLHTYPLPFRLWSGLYASGQKLVVTPIRQTPAECWPVELKCRSRMHYYLADRLARQARPGARALLLDLAGHVCEASTASVLMVHKSEGLAGPAPRTILPGVSLEFVAELASRLGLPFRQRDISPAELARADEVLLCGTSPCVWPATELDGQPLGGGVPGPWFRRLLAAWSEAVGVDIAAQAERFANRPESAPVAR